MSHQKYTLKKPEDEVAALPKVNPLVFVESPPPELNETFESTTGVTFGVDKGLFLLPNEVNEANGDATAVVVDVLGVTKLKLANGEGLATFSARLSSVDVLLKLNEDIGSPLILGEFSETIDFCSSSIEAVSLRVITGSPLNFDDGKSFTLKR